MGHSESGNADRILHAADLLPADLPLDDQGRLAEDLSCHICGYLRGADPRGACPECGSAAGWSIIGDLLRYSEPRWMRQVARGAFTIVAALAMAMIHFSLRITIMTIDIARWEEIIQRPVLDQLSLLLILLNISILIAGVWRLTTPEAAKQDSETLLHARKLARFGFVVSLVLGAAFLITINWSYPSIHHAIFALVLTGFLVASAMMTFGFFGYLRQLGQRIPNTVMSRQAVMLRVSALPDREDPRQHSVRHSFGLAIHHHVLGHWGDIHMYRERDSATG